MMMLQAKAASARLLATRGKVAAACSVLAVAYALAVETLVGWAAGLGALAGTIVLAAALNGYSKAYSP